MSACLVCGADAPGGPIVGIKQRHLCDEHRTAWAASGEAKRAFASASTRAARLAFMDWLTRVRAERRNAAT